MVYVIMCHDRGSGSETVVFGAGAFSDGDAAAECAREYVERAPSDGSIAYSLRTLELR